MPISSCRTFHIKNLSSHALTCCFTALVSTRSSLCDPKWLFCVCVFFMPPPSNSRDLLSPCMSICSLCASHTLMILFHVFSCRLSTLVFSRHPICGLKRLFCVFNLTSPSTFRDPLSPCMSICSLTRLTLSSSDVMRFSCPARRLCVASDRFTVQNGCSACFCCHNEPISGFSAPSYVSLLPRRVSYSHHLTTYTSPARPGAGKLQTL